MLERIRQFVARVWDKVEDRLAGYIAGFIVFAFLAAILFSWRWSSTKHSLELYGWIWLLLSIFLIFLLVYFLFSVLRDRGRLTEPKDIEAALEDWFAHGDEYGIRVEKNMQYYFVGVEKNLNLKRGCCKLYLPMVAWKHGYFFEMGKKTFKLTQLTYENDVTTIFERHLSEKFSPHEKEFLLSCNEIDKRLGWPEGVTKLFLNRNRPQSEEFEIEDKDNDKILIRRKI